MASTYTVKVGDSLQSIAEANGLSASDLEAANPHVRNLNLLYPGQEINIAGGASEQAPADDHVSDAAVESASEIKDTSLNLSHTPAEPSKPEVHTATPTPPDGPAQAAPISSQFQQMAIQVQQDAEGFPRTSSYGAVTAPAAPIQAANQGGAASPPPSDVTSTIGLITNNEERK